MNHLQRFANWVLTTPSLFETNRPLVDLKHISLGRENLEIAYKGNPRLGFIYQHLCSLILSNSEQYVLELEEIQINTDSGQTIGAIDFILKNHLTQTFEHWEVAIKFYLLHQETWFGPNAHDQLDKKLHHMLNHQLKMTSNSLFQQAFPDYRHINENLLMQGRLYINPFSDDPVPQECIGYTLNQEQISGYWCYQHQWDLINKPLYELKKSLWAIGLDEFSHPITKPTERFVHAQTKDGDFWFIVANDWPHNNQKD